jgi:hypothetical protein
MKDINDLIQKHYNEGFSFESLLGLINEQLEGLTLLEGKKRKKQVLLEELQEKIIKFPKIKITERWGEKHNEDREIFEDLMSKVRGNTIAAKIASVNEFLAYKKNLPIAEILSNLMFVEIFSMIIEEFNASTAGFLFEAFLAGLFAGEQIADPEQVGAKAGSLPIEDVTLAIRQKDQPVDTIVPYSLKVLSPSVDLKGSFVNIVDYFASGRQDNIVYLVVTKLGQGTLAFNEFTITQDNFLDYIGHEKYEKQKVYEPIEFSPRDMLQPKVTKARGEEYVLTKAWMNSNKVTSVTTQDGKPLEGNLLDPEQTYIANQWQGDYQMVPVGGMTANAKKLYGDEKTFKNLLASKKDVDFWESLKSTKGYLTNQQFHISPGNVRGRSELIGRLDLHPPKLIKVANHYAVDLGRGLVDLYNAVSSLSVNINKYFIGSDKLAGRAAIQDAQTIKSESENLIKVEEN